MAEQALFQPFNRNQQRENLESTKETGLLISLIPSLQEDFYVDSLTTGASKETLSKLLLRNPGIKNETAVIEMIHFLHDEGDRISFSILLPFLVAEYDPKELEEKIRERFFRHRTFHPQMQQSAPFHHLYKSRSNHQNRRRGAKKRDTCMGYGKNGVPDTHSL